MKIKKLLFPFINFIHFFYCDLFGKGVGEENSGNMKTSGPVLCMSPN